MYKPYWQLGHWHDGDELVMGMSNKVVFAGGMWQGCLLDPERTQELVRQVETQAEWRPRREAEDDDTWQQIVPYGFFRVGDLYGEFKRGTGNGISDPRLNLKYTMSVSCHVVKEEFEEYKSLSNLISAIFHQDIDYEGEVTATPVGILNDNSDEWGKFHLGIVFILDGDIPDFQSNIHTEARLVRLRDMTGEDINYLERWSRMVYHQLRDWEISLEEKEG